MNGWAVEEPAAAVGAEFVSFAWDSAGNGHFVYGVRGDGAYYVQRDAGGTWGTPSQIQASTIGPCLVDICIDADDHLHVITVSSSSWQSLTMRYLVNSGGGWSGSDIAAYTCSTPSTIECDGAAIAVTAAGDARAAYAISLQSGNATAPYPSPYTAMDAYYWDGSSASSIYHFEIDYDTYWTPAAYGFLTPHGIVVDSEDNPYILYAMTCTGNLSTGGHDYVNIATHLAIWHGSDTVLSDGGEESAIVDAGGLFVDGSDVVHGIYGIADTAGYGGNNTDILYYVTSTAWASEAITSTGYYYGSIALKDGNPVVSGVLAASNEVYYGVRSGGTWTLTQIDAADWDLRTVIGVNGDGKPGVAYVAEMAPGWDDMLRFAFPAPGVLSWSAVF